MARPVGEYHRYAMRLSLSHQLRQFQQENTDSISGTFSATVASLSTVLTSKSKRMDLLMSMFAIFQAILEDS